MNPPTKLRKIKHDFVNKLVGLNSGLTLLTDPNYDRAEKKFIAQAFAEAVHDVQVLWRELSTELAQELDLPELIALDLNSQAPASPEDAAINPN